MRRPWCFATQTGLLPRPGALAAVGLLALLLGSAGASAGEAPASSDAAAAVRPTRAKVACAPDELRVSSPARCTATVTDIGSGRKIAPAGSVGFTSSGSGAFDATSCTLAATGTGAISSCAVTYTPGRIGTGEHTITSSYAGNDVHGASSARVELSISPPNDDRRAAAPLGAPPASLRGTTAGSTVSFSDPDPRCASVEGTVWYGFSARAPRRIAVRLKAHGNLDAAVAVFKRVRSQLVQVGCVPTDSKGIAGVAFDAVKRGRYLILVGQRESSAASTFSLELFAPPFAKPPGAPLPRHGVRSLVDPLTKPEQAWSVRLAAGKTYRINLAADGGRCLPLYLFAGKTRSFSDTEPARYSRCGGYLVFTPGPDEGGRYSLLVESEGGRGGIQRYRLQVARAGVDDVAPGLLLQNGQTRRGMLSGVGTDVLDLYRLDVAHRTDVTVRLGAGKHARFELLLVSSGGRRIACACRRAVGGTLRTRLDPDTYFLAVRARDQSSGPYAVSLLIREITTTTALLSGSPDTTATPRQPVVLTADVTPGAAIGGRVRFQVDRFDPIEGWQFHRLFFARVGAGGSASVSWTPPSVGRWRVRAVFVGTRSASPSTSGHAVVVVGAPAK